MKAAVLLVALSALGCASHSDRMEPVRDALDARRPRDALQRLNEELDVDSAKELPEDLGDDDASLLLLDRAMLLQQLGYYKLSSRDLEICDKHIQTLDFSRNAVDDIGKYMFSDDTGPYKAPAYEKLFINTMNMVNYLARGELNGARIEARRLAVMQAYIKQSDDPATAMLGPGSYLAGFTFEKSGRADEALRYYDEALAYGQYESLREPIRRLAKRSSYRSPRITAMLGEHETIEQPQAEAAEDQSSEVLVVVSFGRVPIKVARRVPIGLALTYAATYMDRSEQARANHLAAQGLVTWVNYPELGKPRGSWDSPGFALNGKWQQMEGAVAIDLEARRAWDDVKGAVVASAITRLLTRIVAGEAVRRSTDDGVVGILLSLGTQATMTAFDTPDTRSWELLPARMAFGRLRLPPGKHWVDLEARGTRKRVQIDLPPKSYQVLNLTTLY
jgi:uncharacterized protein